jgi:hypothetical protein
VKALVVNCSAPRYNLGAAKCADWLRTQGHQVTVIGGDPGMLTYGYELVALSVIFSWHAPIARDIALRVRANAEVWCGGPGVAALAHWWKTETGLDLTVGLDWRFERQRGDYAMTFAARGCPVGCWFCIVPKIEGRNFTLDWDFRPAPTLCDNNLSALPTEFQDHIIQRYRESGMPLTDANSGFEPRAFDEGTFARWEPLLKATDAPWRFAFDELREADDVRRVCEILSTVRSKRKRVWVLVGNESIAECYDRARSVLEWGGEPWCQFVLPLNWLGDPATLRPRHDWSYQLGRDFCRYFNRRLWRTLRIEDYRPRQNEPEPFKTMKVAA